MLKWLLGTIFGAIIGISAYFTLYLGAFKPVNILEKQVGPLQLLYKIHVGPYHKIVQTLDEVEKWAKDNHVPCERTFGEFIDNPNTIEEGRLRANCGCVVDNAPLPTVLPEGLLTKTLPLKKYVSVDFDGSPGIGPMKVYPKVTEYFDAKKALIAGPTLEIYKIHDAKSMTTTYLFPME